jgi:hypothetical protein
MRRRAQARNAARRPDAQRHSSHIARRLLGFRPSIASSLFDRGKELIVNIGDVGIHLA